MDLKDFIQSAVSQIVEGMVAAQAAAAADGATLNPAVDVAKGNPSAASHTAAGARPSNITFDVAVTAVEGVGGEGGARLRVVGAGSGPHARDEPVTRIQFSLPIALPPARPRRSTATALDSEFLQTVESDDSTWLPAS